MNLYQTLVVFLFINAVKTVSLKTINLKSDWKMVITSCANQHPNFIGK